MTTGIYKITGPSGKCYIGSAVHFERRWAKHRYQLRQGQHHSHILQAAWDKYGGNAFVFEVLRLCSQGDLLAYEQAAIDELKPRYNVRLEADSALGIKRRADRKHIRSEGQRGRRHSPETLLKIGAASRGRKQSEASLKQRSDTAKATMATPEVKARMTAAARLRASDPAIGRKISVALTGIVRSEETRHRMSEAQKGRPSTLRGVPRTPEVKAKIAAGIRAAATRRRLSAT